MVKSLGICIGATTISLVVIRSRADGSWEKELSRVLPHQGNPRLTFVREMERLDTSQYARIAVTGRRFRHYIKLPAISEAEAVESALEHMNGHLPPLDAVVSAGGETFMVYVLGRNYRIISVRAGNKCASGTGEFFLQQLRRIGLSVEEALDMARSEKPYRVSGRCSVFCKSDCTHATNKGVPKGRVVAGLCEMMAGKILEILRPLRRNTVMVIGGTAQNKVVIDHLRKEIKNLVVPEEAPYFEALGAALWAMKAHMAPALKFSSPASLLKTGKSSFTFHPPLLEAAHLVEFRHGERDIAQKGDRCILGLDVGSTTTKAVIVRTSDYRMLASVYLRTEGNPVRAARACYEKLEEKLGALAGEIEIVALGVTGSGRQIAGLHAMTDGVINEIVAHATAALYFDPGVDTIFEIGGQDAKYTLVKDGYPADYAMNDACSAGTGSFLEEAARETMGVAMEEIGELALQGKRPPNFNDQCAAFISSDIKNAIHEGIEKKDILAGLVYSVCMNYINRVRGNRAVGDRVFMQGGVCYNRAVPLSMASLTGKKIVVPPDPGLMGAFGVALEVDKWLKLKLLKEGKFSLRELKERELAYGEPFICDGGKEGCDRKCEISRIIIGDKVFPFGGACNRWYNLRRHIKVEAKRWDFVRQREELVFRIEENPEASGKTIGINRSFLISTYLPLYRKFFSLLGYRVVLPQEMREIGCELKGAPFCYPAELAHGFFARLIELSPDYIFLPQVKGAIVEGEVRKSTTCPLSQAEPYYLRSAFRREDRFLPYLRDDRLITPVIDFSYGYGAMEGKFISLGKKLGATEKEGRAAYWEAVRFQREIFQDLKREVKELLDRLWADKASIAVILFGRSYNAFVSEAHKGIPHKFASRGIPVIPFDLLPFEEEEAPETMYWSAGGNILKAAKFVSRHPSLFPCYITNFSCGPDSFLLTYFAREMKGKPYLILELDSHTADAGLETRIEAFLDIVKNYERLEKRREIGKIARGEKRKTYFDYGRNVVVDREGRAYPLTHPRVHLVMPPMGPFVNAIGTAIFRSRGIRATPLPRADEEVLKLGRGHASCKECLPLLITIGSLLGYLKEREEKDEILVYFMPTAGGPCRFGQYSPFTEALLESSGIDGVALYSLQAEDGYLRHLDSDFTLSLWSGIVTSDLLQDIYSLLYTNAENRTEAMACYEEEMEKLLRVFETAPQYQSLLSALEASIDRLSRIPLKRTWAQTPTILLTGEIYVRHDDLSRRNLIEMLGEEGFACKVSSILEWVYYTDYCFRHGLDSVRPGLKELLRLWIRRRWLRKYEASFKRVSASFGLTPYRLEKTEYIVERGDPLISKFLTGEAILTVGAAMAEVPVPYCGAIAIGPFGCMPNRLAESILSVEMGYDRPFLAIETDGTPFPQMITARLEIFLLQARRVFEEMKKGKGFPR